MIGVYFGTSPNNKEKNRTVIERIYNLIDKFGYRHTSVWVKKVSREMFYKMSEREWIEHQEQTEREVGKADICVFEVSSRSLSVGFLASMALSKGKIVILLSKSEKLLSLFRSVNSRAMIAVSYNEENLDKVLEGALSRGARLVNMRFNFFLPKNLLAQLDWAAMNLGVNRSGYIRGLIEKDMKRNKKYGERL